MAEIHFKKRESLQVPDGANLMRSLLDAGLPVASSCNGDGICGKCKIEILDGMSGLSSPNDLEEILKHRYSLDRQTRISCQCTVHGKVTVDAKYW